MLDVITGRPFIQALAQRNVITGFADGTFGRMNQWTALNLPQ